MKPYNLSSELNQNVCCLPRRNPQHILLCNVWYLSCAHSMQLAPPLGERLNPNGEGIVRVYVSPSCTDLTKEELSGGEAGLGIPFNYTVSHVAV
jgi:hypothetical protein